jgi:anti-sigma-K factor RskA
MSHSVATDEIRELAALYALGALSQHEARAFEVHLRQGCSVCESELSEFDGVVGLLGLDTPEVAPPPYLRDLLTARIEREDAADGRPISKAPVAAAVRQERREPTNVSRPSRSLLPWAIAASFAIVGIASFLAWRVSEGKNAQLRREQTESLLAVAENQKTLDREIRFIRQQAKVHDIAIMPDHREIPMSGSQGRGRVFWDTRDKRWVVTADLPVAPSGKVYQLWFVTPTAKISAGLMTTDDQGHGFAEVPVTTDASSLAAAAITLEPDGGSPQPTSEIYLVGKVE